MKLPKMNDFYLDLLVLFYLLIHRGGEIVRNEWF